MDVDTSFPYCVIGKSIEEKVSDRIPLFSVIVCHDIFDTYERMQILFQKLVGKYPGLMSLLT